MMKIKVLKVRIDSEYLELDQQKIDDFLVSKEIVNVETAFVQEESYWSVFVKYNDMANLSSDCFVEENITTKYTPENDILTESEYKILEVLKLWRSERAKEKNLPVYCIASNKDLVSVAKFKPLKKEELLQIKGFGKHKIENYGQEILEILESI